MSNRKKRGLDKCEEQFKCFLENGLGKLLKDDKELFLGIRDNYVNIYYNCCSLARWEFRKRGETGVVIIHRKYLGDLQEGMNQTKSDYRSIDPAFFIKNYDIIRKNAGRISTGESSTKTTREKIAQQVLVTKNNANPQSKWYCTDIEYTQSQMDDGTPGFGRFDIVALSRKPENGKYKIALVELKVGTAAFPSSIKTDYKNESKKAAALEAKRKIETNEFKIAEYNGSLGSGILGHFADFYRFMQYGQFNQLRDETCCIINAKLELKDLIGETDFPYGQELKPGDISEEPEYHFVTHCGSGQKDFVIDTFKRYLLDAPTNGKAASKLSVKKVFSQSDKWENLMRYQIYFHFTEKQESEIDDFLAEPEENLLPNQK